jgi:pimeloyl-ACP methyl ester carboxylesterase
MRLVRDAGHFLSLDAPAEAVQAIVEFVDEPLATIQR